MLERLTYLARTAVSNFDKSRFACPNCGEMQSTILSRKALVTTLRRCSACELQFRAPTDPPEHNMKFYNLLYNQGFTTILPEKAELEQLLSSSFKNSPKNFDCYIDDMVKLGVTSGAKVLDFGCSWGYGSWQMTKAGYDVWSSEIGQDRANYGKQNLGIRLVDAYALAEDRESVGSFDCFFSSHVIEHVPVPQQVFDLARKLLKPGGIFLSYTPNGSQEHRQASPNWDYLWGLVHPNFIDDKFLATSFRELPMVFASRQGTESIPDLEMPTRGINKLLLDHYELVFAAKNIAAC